MSAAVQEVFHCHKNTQNNTLRFGSKLLPFSGETILNTIDQKCKMHTHTHTHISIIRTREKKAKYMEL
jgi:hypothetical protein